MKEILERLSRYETLDRKESKDVLIRISQEKYKPVEVAAFLMTFRMRPVEVPEILGFCDALLELCVPFDTGGRETIDVCGTGGDGKNTFNISTATAFVLAGAGYPVVKHGNYAVSSSCGSSNVLESLGYRFSNNPGELSRQLDRANICYLHAPVFHPAMKGVAPVRREMGIKTVFNMLGPLVNPSRPTHQLTGVYKKEIMRLYQSVLNESVKKYAVVHSSDGYDEVSLTGNFHLYTRDGIYFLSPADVAQQPVSQDALSGGNDVEEAKKILLNVLEGKGNKAQNAVVAVNAALAIRCFEAEKSFEDCLGLARENLEKGAGMQALKKLIDR